jgi:hypothetical protein
MATDIEAASWQFLFWILSESFVPLAVHPADIALELPLGELAPTDVAHSVGNVGQSGISGCMAPKPPRNGWPCGELLMFPYIEVTGFENHVTGSSASVIRIGAGSRRI